MRPRPQRRRTHPARRSVGSGSRARARRRIAHSTRPNIHGSLPGTANQTLEVENNSTQRTEFVHSLRLVSPPIHRRCSRQRRNPNPLLSCSTKDLGGRPESAATPTSPAAGPDP